MQSRVPRFEFTAEMSFSSPLISIVHLIKKMSEDEKLKIGKRIIFSLCDKTAAPVGVRRCRGAFRKEMKSLLGGGEGSTCMSSEIALATWREVQPHAHNRTIATSA